MNAFFYWIYKICSYICKLLRYFGFKRKPPPVILRPTKTPKKVIAAYFSSDTPRSSQNLVEMNPKLITHLYYAFVEVHPDGSIALQDPHKAAMGNYPEKFIAIKRLNPNLKLIFSCIPKGNSFTVVAENKELRKAFVNNTIELLQIWNFDGLDLDWEYPKLHDKESYILLLMELKQRFNDYGYLLTAAVRAIPVYRESGYDVPKMSKYLDYINIMTYDYYGSWSTHTGFNSPLYPSSLDTQYERQYLNVEASVRNWIGAGAPPEKICIGIPFYGRTFTLKDELENGVHAPIVGAGKPPAVTYYKVITQYTNWTTVWDDEQKGIYKYNANQWIGYDDHKTIKAKVKFALDKDIAGVFVWHLGGDDMTGETSGLKQFLLCHIYTQMTSDRKTREAKEPSGIEPIQPTEPSIVIDTDPSYYEDPELMRTKDKTREPSKTSLEIAITPDKEATVSVSKPDSHTMVNVPNESDIMPGSNVEDAPSPRSNEETEKVLNV
ncbi:chitinase-3-like protein 1 isoform X2 [Rhynchophorus ferrugineus]|uniref:chitinase-3-like protein 1 isoform X2 n=1 Tax=Rhynchophorus ferrugineus TaxID=354439 RepID=UPI003FCDDDE7